METGSTAQPGHADSAGKTPIYKQKWFWIAIGILVIVSVIYNAAKPPSDTTTPSPSKSPASAARQTPSQTSSPTQTPTPIASPTSGLSANDVDQALRSWFSDSSKLGDQPWSIDEPWVTLCNDDLYDPFPCRISSISLSAGSGSRTGVTVNIQATLSSDDGKRYATSVLNILCSEANAATFSTVSGVTVADGAGNVKGYVADSTNYQCQHNR